MLNKFEQELHLNMSADNREEWSIFTDDPYWIRLISKYYKPVKKIGEGYSFSVPYQAFTFTPTTTKVKRKYTKKDNNPQPHSA